MKKRIYLTLPLFALVACGGQPVDTDYLRRQHHTDSSGVAASSTSVSTLSSRSVAPRVTRPAHTSANVRHIFVQSASAKKGGKPERGRSAALRAVKASDAEAEKITADNGASGKLQVVTVDVETFVTLTKLRYPLFQGIFVRQTVQYEALITLAKEKSGCEILPGMWTKTQEYSWVALAFPANC